MGGSLERRQSQGRRRSDDRETTALRGLLHDLGHELTTLSYLVQAVRGDARLPDDSSYRLELLSLEMSRLLEIIKQGMDGLHATGSNESVEVRQVATQLTRLAQLSYPADVRLAPGAEVAARVDPLVLWRVLSNVVENAARAAGPAGHVVLAVRQDNQAIIEVTDDGPGFGAGPPGTSSLGLEVVTSLLSSCGGSLEVESPRSGGTTVRISLPVEVAARAGVAARR